MTDLLCDFPRRIGQDLDWSLYSMCIWVVKTVEEIDRNNLKVEVGGGGGDDDDSVYIHIYYIYIYFWYMYMCMWG